MPAIAKRPAKIREPLWKGPSIDGITFSLLSRFLVCRERFRLRVVEGLVEDEGFNASIEYGSLFHEAEEAHRKGKPWDLAIKKYRTKLLANYSTQESEIHKWAAICLKQYPLYLDYWRSHEDESERKPLLAEAPFAVPYTLPSGRTVLLRGKFDAVTILPIESTPAPRDSAAAKANKRHKPNKLANGRPQPRTKAPQPALSIFLQENKTKGQIDEEGILGTVSQNLQSMLYQIALRQFAAVDPDGGVRIPSVASGHLPPKLAAEYARAIAAYPIAGTLYNVIRRPLADRYAIKQREGRMVNRKVKVGSQEFTHKPIYETRKVREGAETSNQFYERVAQTIRDDPGYFFMRWKVLLDDEDMTRFKQRVFDPILEQLCDWWEWISVDPFDPWRQRSTLEFNTQGEYDRWSVQGNPHYQTPWGIYNSMFGGFRGDYFEYLTKDRQFGLTKIETLFPELT